MRKSWEALQCINPTATGMYHEYTDDERDSVIAVALTTLAAQLDEVEAMGNPSRSEVPNDAD